MGETVQHLIYSQWGDLGVQYTGTEVGDHLLENVTDYQRQVPMGWDVKPTNWECEWLGRTGCGQSSCVQPSEHRAMEPEGLSHIPLEAMKDGSWNSQNHWAFLTLLNSTRVLACRSDQIKPKGFPRKLKPSKCSLVVGVLQHRHKDETCYHPLSFLWWTKRASLTSPLLLALKPFKALLLFPPPIPEEGTSSNYPPSLLV